MNSVGLTSKWIAAARALESQRADRLFEDPFAGALAGPEGSEYLDKLASLGQGRADVLSLRTRFFDDTLLASARHAERPQIVILAAGMDARAFRLPWPEGTTLFELDQPEVLAQKAERLSTLGAVARCERKTVAVNLSDNWEPALRSAGFAVNRPTHWLLEGLLIYFDVTSVDRLLRSVSALSAPGSWLGADFMAEQLRTHEAMESSLQTMARLDAPWTFGCDAPGVLLGQHGFEASVSEVSEYGRRFGRWPYPMAPGPLPFPMNFFVEAVHR